MIQKTRPVLMRQSKNLVRIARLRRMQLGLTLLMLLIVAPSLWAQSTGVSSPPEGFVPPSLHPAGVELKTQELAPGVYGLIASKPPVDNVGFVVGDNGVLVIDSHINGAMAGQIQDAVRRVTDKPIRYLVNTNYHGDHTFGNYAFPESTQIIAHRATAERMQHFEREKQFLLRTVNNDAAVFADSRLRMPDVVFEDYMRIDLGGRVVELYHFGPGNTPGDTVVYQPESQVAWTGNLVLGRGTIPFLIEGGATAYLSTITQLSNTLELKTIIPGHGRMTSGIILSRYLNYLSELIHTVRQATQSAHTLDSALANLSLGEQYLPPADSPQARARAFLTGLHRWNVQTTYHEFSRN